MSEMATYGIVPQGKPKLKARSYHGYAVVLFILGTLFPPLAVAARFGINSDFWLNLLLTICGYIPGHVHNFYIQNIRNNKNHARTPKWVQKYGLVDLSEIRRKERKSQWANRYKDRLPASTYEGQPLAEGQEQDSSNVDLNSENGRPRHPNGELWNPEEEQYYNADTNSTSSQSRWHYPANFDDAVMDSAMLKQSKKKNKKHDKKNRWERTQDAYSLPPDDEEDTGKKRKSKKKKKRSSTDSIQSQEDPVNEYPEDPVGGLYGNTSKVGPTPEEAVTKDKTTEEDLFRHQF